MNANEELEIFRALPSKFTISMLEDASLEADSLVVSDPFESSGRSLGDVSKLEVSSKVENVTTVKPPERSPGEPSELS